MVPAGDGAEAFVDAEDIAAVASATLADPRAHAGAQYVLTGPEALTIAEAAKIISRVSGQAVDYTDIDRGEWVAGAVAGGVPAEYGAVLGVLTETIASGRGARPGHDIEKVTGAAPASFADFARGARPRPGLRTGPMTAVSNLADFRALDPFFRIIEEGVAGLADGEHFFDLLTEDVVFEYVITVPGYPRRVEGRQAVAELYRPYGATFFLDRCYDLAIHHDQASGVVVLEYASQGRAVSTGNAYRNRYISVLSITDRKIAHWRDYLDPLAVFDAIGWPAAGGVSTR